ncbi:ATP-binding protein [Kitasatospora purpeofusca]|uniref:ATP-binding protein n=1 Tax=Kitasatospora purpeofusca TaxID=67352 RepID=UPI0035E136A3
MPAPRIPITARPEPGWFLLPEPAGFRLHLEVTAPVLARVRATTRTHLGGHLPTDVVEIVELILTELLTNVHNALGPHAPASVSVIRDKDWVRLVVADPDPTAGPPAPRLHRPGPADLDAEHGRGLFLIDTLGAHRHTHYTATGKQVHCQVPAVR